jgi:hypothetical protein
MKIRYQADNDVDQIIRQEVAIRDAALWLQFFHEVGTPEDFINTIRIVSLPF